MNERPRLLITMGDVAGVGPEVIARAWPRLLPLCRPTVVGDVAWLNRAASLVGQGQAVAVHEPGEVEATANVLPCLVVTQQDLSSVLPGLVHPLAGRAAYDFLIAATDRALAGTVEGIVTAPLNKEALRLAGLPHPGHTEILAERCGVEQFAMLLWGDGLAVAHVTLHLALREVFANLTEERVLEKIRLLHDLLPRLLGRAPRIAVAALNPHAGDGGLFGDEESTILTPAIDRARGLGIQVSGPYPADTLFVRAHKGEFDGIVAPYHDQGHIAMKLRSGWRCVNITAGLPIVRTSVAHGTAYDIAWKGVADASSLVEAVDVAARLSARPR